MRDFEQVLRENATKPGLVGSEFTLKVLAEGQDQLELSIEPVMDDSQAFGEVVDFAVSGPNVEILED